MSLTIKSLRITTQRNLLMLLSVSLLCVIIALMAPHYVQAVQRATTPVCNKDVYLIDFGTLPSGQDYYTFEYVLNGNDNARAYWDPNISPSTGLPVVEAGSRLDSEDGTCTDRINREYWTGSTIDLNTIPYQSFFTGRNVHKYLGSPPGFASAANPTPVIDSYADPLIGIDDQCQDSGCTQTWRQFFGITKTRTDVFATVNDAGLAQFNGVSRWCAGMALNGFNPPEISLCRADASQVYDWGGDFGGYQNTDEPGAINNVEPSWRAAVSNSGELPGIGMSFNLRLLAQNTRDSIKNAFWGNSCYNTSAPPNTGDPACAPPGITEPDNRTKTSVVISYVLDQPGNGTPPPPPPPPDPNYYRLEPAVTDPAVVQGPVTSTVSITTSINKSISDIPNQGVKAFLKRYMWIENPIGTPINPGYNFGNSTSGEAYDFPDGVFAVDHYEIGRVNERCITNGAAGACGADNSVVADTWTVDNSNLPPGSRICTLALVITHFGTADAGANATPTPPVDFDGSQELNDPNPQLAFFNHSYYGASSVHCTGLSALSLKPYFRTYGGDVLAGSGFGTSCGPDTSNPDNTGAKIIAFNDAASGFGSAAQLAAQAVAAIDGFATATQRNNPGPPGGLSLANDSGGFGGNFGNGICAEDYFNISTTITGLVPPTTPQSLGAQVITSANDDPLYIDSNLKITGNITYDQAGWTANDMPNFYVIVRGNIYIDPSVTKLEGTYIAQPRLDPVTGAVVPNTGYIYTCSDGNYGAPTGAQWNACGNKLTVHGSFVAQVIKLFRTRGTITDGAKTDGPTDDDPAEVFINGPESWISGSPFPTLNSADYDSIRSLPPVL